MNYFVYINGEQQGPLTKEQLKQLNITPDTLVWYEGLPEWKPASQAEGTAWLFAQPVQPPQPPQQPQSQQPQQPQVQPSCPESYLAWAILSTLFCCLPFGIVAIIKASSVNEKYLAGDHSGAKLASEEAKKWCWVAFGCGIGWVLIYAIIVASTGAAFFAY